jgi:hypothetical protein
MAIFFRSCLHSSSYKPDTTAVDLRAPDGEAIGALIELGGFAVGDVRRGLISSQALRDHNRATSLLRTKTARQDASACRKETTMR